MLKMEKRFNLKKAIRMNVTIRAKILCIISWIFKVHIVLPYFEENARMKKYYKESFYKDPGRYFQEGIERD